MQERLARLERLSCRIPSAFSMHHLDLILKFAPNRIRLGSLSFLGRLDGLDLWFDNRVIRDE